MTKLYDLGFRFFPYRNITYKGYNILLAIVLIVTQTYFDRKFCSILFLGKQIQPHSHRPALWIMGIGLPIVTMFVVVTVWDQDLNWFFQDFC